MTAIFNSLFWPVSVSIQPKVPHSSLCTTKVSGSILRQSPNSYNTKDRLRSRQYPQLVGLFTVAASGGLCILLAFVDASAVPSFSINSIPSLMHSQSLNMAMEMEIRIPVTAGVDDDLGMENMIYASAPELAISMKKNENDKRYAGNLTRCPQWNLNEYEIVVPNLPRKPNSKSFPRQSYYWINAHSRANPSLHWNPKIYYRTDSFARPGGTGNIQIIRPTDGNMLFYECFSL